MKRIRVLIVEDSQVIRELLQYIIEQDPRLQVVGAVDSAEEALRILSRVSPDVISMDIRLPGMNGLEATRRIMSENPTPIVVISASVECSDLQITMNALQAGALTVLEKPAGINSADYDALSKHLCTQLAIMSQVKVVRRKRSARSAPRAEPHRALSRDDHRILGIVSSTGGPAALVQVLGSLGPVFRLPIALVQHITSSFLEGFASWLEKAGGFPVVIVKERTPLHPGTIYLATRDRHLRVLPGYVQVDAGDPVCVQRPSGTVLFDSIADAYRGQAIGVLLTGMGEDGAQGLLRIRNQGGYTIAEHESTAVVYGMPGEAVRLGGVCESLPLPEIAPRILDLTFQKNEVA